MPSRLSRRLSALLCAGLLALTVLVGGPAKLAFEPQPIPPGGPAKLAFEPQPIPPGAKYS